jgi:hypothetical protein
MKQISLLMVPLLILISGLILGSQSVGQNHPDLVLARGFAWCEGHPCYNSKIALTTLRD